MADFMERRQEVVDICHRLSASGFLAGTGGNVALRVDEEHFLLTPSATDYATMGARDIAVMRLDTLEQVEGNRPGSVERGLHARLLGARPERPASLHTHQPVASAVAVLRERLAWRPDVDRARFGDHVALVPYRPSGTGMLAKALGRGLAPGVHAYLLASHGVICAAATLDEAAGMVAEIEASAAAFLLRSVAANSSLPSVLRDFALGHLEGLPTEPPAP